MQTASSWGSSVACNIKFSLAKIGSAKLWSNLPRYPLTFKLPACLANGGWCSEIAWRRDPGDPRKPRSAPQDNPKDVKRPPHKFQENPKRHRENPTQALGPIEKNKKWCIGNTLSARRARTCSPDRTQQPLMSCSKRSLFWTRFWNMFKLVLKRKIGFPYRIFFKKWGRSHATDL